MRTIWDTASKATELSDFNVCTTWGIAGKDLYLLDVLRRRMERAGWVRVDVGDPAATGSSRSI